MGTDYPFPWNTAPVDHILSIPGISDADKIAMLGGTAAKLARDSILRWRSSAEMARGRISRRAARDRVVGVLRAWSSP